jgi:hypothetical protein
VRTPRAGGEEVVGHGALRIPSRLRLLAGLARAAKQRISPSLPSTGTLMRNGSAVVAIGVGRGGVVVATGSRLGLSAQCQEGEVSGNFALTRVLGSS